MRHLIDRGGLRYDGDDIAPIEPCENDSFCEFGANRVDFKTVSRLSIDSPR